MDALNGTHVRRERGPNHVRRMKYRGGGYERRCPTTCLGRSSQQINREEHACAEIGDRCGDEEQVLRLEAQADGIVLPEET